MDPADKAQRVVGVISQQLAVYFTASMLDSIHSEAYRHAGQAISGLQRILEAMGLDAGEVERVMVDAMVVAAVAVECSEVAA